MMSAQAVLLGKNINILPKAALNRLKSEAEIIIAEDYAGCRAGQSTTEQLFKVRIVCENYNMHHQIYLCHVFVDL